MERRCLLYTSQRKPGQRGYGDVGRIIIKDHDGGGGASVLSRLILDGTTFSTPPICVSMPEILISHSPVIEDATIPSHARIKDALIRSIEG